MAEDYYDPAKYEPDKQEPRLTRAEQVAAQLADSAEKLLAQQMASPYPRKHKWATGREKWEALQLDGAKAAGVTGRRRGRPAKPEPTAEELVADFLTRLTRYQGWVVTKAYLPAILETERTSILRDQRALASSHLLSDELLALADVVLAEPAISE